MSSDGSDSDDGLCDYEKKRLENIRKNQELLKSLGLPVKRQPKKKQKPKPKRKRHDSDSSEDEWQPWMETEVKRPRRAAAVKARLPPLDVVNKKQILVTVNAQVDQKIKDFLAGDKKALKPPPPKRTRAPKQSTNEPPAIELPDCFNSDDDETEFHGFSAAEVLKESAMFELAISESEWERLFGGDDKDPDFFGFTKQDLESTPLPEINRYPKRVRKMQHYEEPELSDEDEYLFCDDCDTLHHGDCPVHGPLRTLDQTNTYDKASLTYTNIPVPVELTVRTSGIPNAGCGVFANQFIPRGVRVGPYEGKVIPKDDLEDGRDTNYMWEIRREGQRPYYIDGRDESTSCWLRFVNCARNEEEQNMVAFQYRGQIYYRTFKHIYPGTELLVWYGEEYAKELGISLNFDDMGVNYTCKGCGSNFVENSSFQIHLKNSARCAAANPQIFKCGKCLQTFGELHLLQYHIRRHLQVQTLQNEEPQNVRTIPQQLPSVRSNTCDYCDKTFRTTSALRTHLRTHTGDKPFKCQYCNKGFNRSSTLQTHLRTHTGDKPYSCDYCGYSCSRNSSMKTHLRTHTGDKPYSCDYCGYSCSQSSALKRHLRTHTGDKPYSCDYCGYSCNQSSAMKSHIRTHTGDKPYSCDYCGYSCSVSITMKRHLRTHTGDKPYSCDYCGYSCSQSSALKRHLRTHTGDKPYSCDYCGYSCNQSSAMKSHIRTHTGDKPYSCDYCGYSCSVSITMKRHLRTHTGDKPYSCDYCGYSCSVSINLKSHIRRHHKDKV